MQNKRLQKTDRDEKEKKKIELLQVVALHCLKIEAIGGMSGLVHSNGCIFDLDVPSLLFIWFSIEHLSTDEHLIMQQRERTKRRNE